MVVLRLRDKCNRSGEHSIDLEAVVLDEQIGQVWLDKYVDTRAKGCLLRELWEQLVALKII